MQAYRVEELIVPNPNDPDPVKKQIAVINLDHLITWRPFSLYGIPCTILKLSDYNVRYPPDKPYLTWVYIAEDFEDFDAKMMALNQVKSAEEPDEPFLPPMGIQSANYKGASGLEWYEIPLDKDQFVTPPGVPPDLKKAKKKPQKKTEKKAAKKKS